MKPGELVVSGADGFVGRRFLELFGEEFEHITALVRSPPHPARRLARVRYRVADLADELAMGALAERSSAFVHCAHDFKDPSANLRAARNVLSFCRRATVQRLVYLSTIAVYDQTVADAVTETTGSARFRDPYVQSKLQIERLLQRRAAQQHLDVIMLQPTIVFGWGGSWSRTAIEGCTSERIVLPLGGEGVCNYVYVEDVCRAIMKALCADRRETQQTGSRRYIVSGPQTASWSEFYLMHCALREDAPPQCEPTIEAPRTTRRFDDSGLRNLLMAVLLNPAAAFPLTAAVGLLRRLRPARPRQRIIEDWETLARLDAKPAGIQAFAAMPRLYLGTTYVANIERARTELGYQPAYDLERAIEAMRLQRAALLTSGGDRARAARGPADVNLAGGTGSETLRTDVCVIGTGIGGGSFISRYLQRSGRLLAIDAGGERDSDVVGLESVGRDLGLSLLREISVGGTSNVWRGVCAPMDRVDFTRRDWIAESGWPVDGATLEPYYRLASELLNLPDYALLEHPERINRSRDLTRDIEFDRSVFANKYFLQTRPPKRFRDELNAWFVQRPNSALLEESVALELITNESGTHVERVLVKNKNGQTRFIEARCFIVCAGALETPRLLLNSRSVQTAGIGNAHGLVGKQLMDHPMVSVGQVRFKRPRRAPLYHSVNLSLTRHIKAGIVMNDALQRHHRLPNHCVYLLPSFTRGLDDRYERLRRTLITRRGRGLTIRETLQLLSNANTIHWGLSYLLPIDAYYRHADLYFIAEQTPGWSSCVQLGQNEDRFGYPIARVNWVVSDSDLESIETFGRLLLEAFPTDRYEVSSRRRIEEISDGVTSAAHFMGTARMAADARHGVVDPDLKVWGLDNLYVCDASVIPIAGNANPSLTVAALAIRLADRVAAHA